MQDTVSGTVRPTTMDAIATAIIPQNRMATNSREQIIAISATISSSLKMLVVLRMNMDFMCFMRAHYGEHILKMQPFGMT
eukprot:scaffold162283_cov33-Attheya_sp.AAC.1